MPNPDRHARVERSCEYCGESFMARVERVQKGQGRFCSLLHANLYAKDNPKKKLGYENGKSYWEGTRWIVRWYDDDGNIHVTSYQRWWWNVNVEELPDDLYVILKDGDSKNISPDNFLVITKSELNRLRGHRGNGSPHPSIAGENSKWWRGGSSYDGYPTTFSKPLKKRIKIRDEYTCQCCYSQYPTEALDVHHIDRDVSNNDVENLITVCKGCHKGIHGKSHKTNESIEYFQSLLPE